MKKIRILAAILAVLMLPLSLFIACDDKGGDTEQCADGKHSFGRREIVSERTCTEPEVIKRPCKYCDYYEETRKDPKGHVFGDAVSDNNATCTDGGTTSKRCVTCGYREEVGKTPALGHTFIVYTKYDAFIERSICLRCGDAKDDRLLGITLDFEGEETHLSYDKLSIFSATDSKVVEADNSYLSIKREAGVIVGGSEFGITVSPRADVLKGETTETTPSYIVEFDIKIDKDKTGDLILLEGEKGDVNETFLTYDSANGAIKFNLGTSYQLEEEDYGAWINVAVRLNDGKKLYDVYVNNMLVTSSIPYMNQTAYFMGFDLSSLRTAMVAGTDASEFGIDNYKLYIADKPDGYEGETMLEYGIKTLSCGSNIMYKLPACESCTPDMSKIKVNSATCVMAGYYVIPCKVCFGENIQEIQGGAKGHKWNTVDTCAATCTVGAYSNMECSTCGARDIEYDEENTALGHAINKDPASGYNIVEPTCFSGGYTEGVCSREGCGVDLVIDEVSKLGHSLEEGKSQDYFLHPLTCTTNQYASGKCVRYGQDGCTYEFTEKDGVKFDKALGHAINKEAEGYYHQDPSCISDGYSTGKCVRYEECNFVYSETDLVTKALGHSYTSTINTVDGKNKVITTCTRCDYNEVKDVLTRVPTASEMKNYIEEINLNAESISLYNFESDSEKTVRGSLSLGLNKDQTNKEDGISFRDVTLSTKKDATSATTNYYGELKDYPRTDGAPYMRYDAIFAAETRDFVYEISLRRKTGTDKNLALSIGALERTTYSPNLHTLINIKENGEISLSATSETVGKITTTLWTKIALVLHSNPTQNNRPTFDLYIDGKLIAQEIGFGDYEEGSNVSATNEFPNFTAMTLRVDAKEVYGDKYIDIDEMYCYCSNLPIYTVEAIGTNHANTVFADTSLNTVSPAGVPYLKATTADAAGALGENVIITTGANTVYVVENFGTADAPEYGLGVKIGASQTGAPDAVADSLSSIRVGVLKAYGKVLFESDVKIAEGTSKFTLFGGYKNGDSESGAKTCNFVYYENGKLFAHDGSEIYAVTAGEWFTFASVINEYANTYDVYINGKLVCDDMAVGISYKTAFTAYNVTARNSTMALHDITKLEYVIFGAAESGATATYDVSYKNTGVYGRTTPIYIAKAEEEPAE